MQFPGPGALGVELGQRDNSGHISRDGQSGRLAWKKGANTCRVAWTAPGPGSPSGRGRPNQVPLGSRHGWTAVHRKNGPKSSGRYCIACCTVRIMSGLPWALGRGSCLLSALPVVSDVARSGLTLTCRQDTSLGLWHQGLRASERPNAPSLSPRARRTGDLGPYHFCEAEVPIQRSFRMR